MLYKVEGIQWQQEAELYIIQVNSENTGIKDSARSLIIYIRNVANRQTWRMGVNYDTVDIPIIIYRVERVFTELNSNIL